MRPMDWIKTAIPFPQKTPKKPTKRTMKNPKNFWKPMNKKKTPDRDDPGFLFA